MAMAATTEYFLDEYFEDQQIFLVYFFTLTSVFGAVFIVAKFPIVKLCVLLRPSIKKRGRKKNFWEFGLEGRNVTDRV